ncbi:MAG: hypothetical protein Q8N65_01305 [bacterium]|nr:hypothetical protein [bacterium]
MKKQFLLPGIFHPLAYIRDTDKIENAWKRNKTKLNIIAMGVSLYDDWFEEIVNSRLTGGEAAPTKETKKALSVWDSETRKCFPSEYKDIEKTCRILGQYLEFMNRKSQGF